MPASPAHKGAVEGDGHHCRKDQRHSDAGSSRRSRPTKVDHKHAQHCHPHKSHLHFGWRGSLLISTDSTTTKIGVILLTQAIRLVGA